MNSKSIDTPMDLDTKLLSNHGKPFLDFERYKRLFEKQNYLNIIHPNISFGVCMMSKFLNSPCVDHWNVAICILKYIKGSLDHTKVAYYLNVDWAKTL